jgi:hypothetical protein
MLPFSFTSIFEMASTYRGGLPKKSDVRRDMQVQ